MLICVEYNILEVHSLYEQKKLKAIDLFCGVGGLTYGLQKAGIDVIAGIDIDSSCRYAFEKNNNSKEDISKVKGKDLSKYYKNADIKILVCTLSNFFNYSTN